MLERLATLRFDAAAMLNLSADHLDRHGDMAGYAAAKRAIFDRQTADDLAVIGIDDAPSRDHGGAALHGASPTISGGARRICASSDRRADGDRDRAAAPCPARTTRRTPPPPPPWPASLGVARGDDRRGHRKLPGPAAPPGARRPTIDGIIFVNDSKATNADAAARALGCYDR